MTAFETRGRRYRLVIGTHLCHANSLTAIVLRLRDLSPHEPANIFTIHLESDFLLDHPASLQRGSSGQGGARDRSSQSGGRWSSLPSPLLRVRTTATTSVTTFVVPTPLSLSLPPPSPLSPSLGASDTFHAFSGLLQLFNWTHTFYMLRFTFSFYKSFDRKTHSVNSPVVFTVRFTNECPSVAVIMSQPISSHIIFDPGIFSTFCTS